MGKDGYVKINRTIQDNWVWKNKPFSRGQAWVDLIMLANHSNVKDMNRGRLVEYKRGVVHHSILELSELWGWSRGKTKRFLNELEEDGMVSVNSTTHGTTITIVNYDVYQVRGATKCATNGQQTNNKRTTDEHQTDINNNDNKDNNENNDNKQLGNKSYTPQAARSESLNQDDDDDDDEGWYSNPGEPGSEWLEEYKRKGHL